MSSWNKMTRDEFISRLYDKRKDIKVLGEYQGTGNKIECQCLKCGEIWSPYAGSILYYKQGCPRCGLEKMRKSRLTHDEFIRRALDKHPDIEILSEFNGVKNKVHIRCLKCGHEWDVNAGRMINGKVNCPECTSNKKYKWTLEELQEKLSPRYTVLGEYKNTKTPTLTRCNRCGFEWKVQLGRLQKGITDCPRCNASIGEKMIMSFLNDNDIVYESEKQFDDLIGTGGKPLRYDFYLPEQNLLIEFQGQHHHHPYDFTKQNRQEEMNRAFEKQIIHDEMKREYANEHGIDLLEIWYFESSKMNNILSENLL